jgi:hypothetical protein
VMRGLLYGIVTFSLHLYENIRDDGDR